MVANIVIAFDGSYQPMGLLLEESSSVNKEDILPCDAGFAPSLIALSALNLST